MGPLGSLAAIKKKTGLVLKRVFFLIFMMADRVSLIQHQIRKKIHQIITSIPFLITLPRKKKTFSVTGE